MSNLFPNLFAPAKIGNLELKKRVCKAPQSSGMNNMDGTVSERALGHRLAQTVCRLRTAGRSPGADHPRDSRNRQMLRRRGAARQKGRLRAGGAPRRPRIFADQLLLPHHQPSYRHVRRHAGKPRPHSPRDPRGCTSKGRSGLPRYRPPQRHRL